MLAYNISIGILALPMAYAYLGLAGGLLFTAVYALLNYCTSMINWQLSRRHKVDCWPDILGVLFGRYARGFGHVVQGLLQFFLMVVHVITMRKAIEAISAPRYLTCGVAWTFLGAGIMFIPCLYRSLKDCWWLAGACESAAVGRRKTYAVLTNALCSVLFDPCGNNRHRRQRRRHQRVCDGSLCFSACSIQLDVGGGIRLVRDCVRLHGSAGVSTNRA